VRQHTEELLIITYPFLCDIQRIRWTSLSYWIAIPSIVFLKKRFDMNWTIVKGSWKQLKGKMKARRDKLTNNHIGSAEKIEKASPEEECLMQESPLSRRTVLRGALAVTCSLLLPITLLSSPAVAAEDAAKNPKAVKKVSKASVKYQYKPNGEMRCGNCINFIAASKTCKRVAGPIDPNGWCILWGKPA
jgi:hypothetical protein